MMARATRILRIVEHELSRRERALEVDTALRKLHILIRFDERTQEPITVEMNPYSKFDLTRECP